MSDIQLIPRLTRRTAGVLLLLACQASVADGAGSSAQPPGTTVGHAGGAPFALQDDFERPDSPGIGGAWKDCKSIHPDFFEPLGIYDGGVVIADPFTRPGNYGQKKLCPAPLEEGHLYPAIGCAFVDTGSTRVSVSITWSGNHGIDRPVPVSHVEATPLLYVTPGNSRFGFGAWITELWGKPVIWAGYVGAPVEGFEVVAGAFMEDHVPGTQRELELRAEQPGQVTVWLDGEQVSFEDGIGLNPIPVDEALVGSTLHGITVDAHCVNPVSRIPLVKGIESASIRVME